MLSAPFSDSAVVRSNTVPAGLAPEACMNLGYKKVLAELERVVGISNVLTGVSLLYEQDEVLERILTHN